MMNAMPSHPRFSVSASASSARGTRVVSLLALALSLLIPGAALADAPGLPKGYASDELPPPAETKAGPQVAQVQDQVTDEPAAQDETFAETDPAALSDFREPLAAHGTWEEDGTYGTVWVPSSVVVGADFAPYQSHGHWEYTADGDWLWVSDFDWGYIPFHYGRWVWIGGRGWAWIPGRVYAPAWVVFRTSDYGYIGWAPMPPAWYWSGGIAYSLWFTPSAAYVFCPTRHVFHHHVHTYVVRDRDIVQRIGAHSRVYRPAAVSGGTPAGGAAKAPEGQGGSAEAKAPAKGTPYALGEEKKKAGSYVRGPSLAEAQIPSGAEPKVRAAHDARATAYATRSGTIKAKAQPPISRGFVGAPGGSPSFGGQADPRSFGKGLPSSRPMPSGVPSTPRGQVRTPADRTPSTPFFSGGGGHSKPTFERNPNFNKAPSHSVPSRTTPRPPTNSRPSVTPQPPRSNNSVTVPRQPAPAVKSSPAPRSAPTVRSAPSSPKPSVSGSKSSSSGSKSSSSSSKSSSSSSSKRK